jgi:cation diffusion facilitator CzcD-associated flavoprotein CzcO
MAHPARHEADVVIVGAGISGMITARKVLEAELTPLVLEADGRVGGARSSRSRRFPVSATSSPSGFPTARR